MDGNWIGTLGAEPGTTPVGPACSREVVADAVALLGPGPVAWAAAVAHAAEQRVLGALPELAGPSSVDTVRRPTEACVLALLRTLRTGAAPASVEVPPEAAAGSHDLVHRGIALDRLLRGVWTAHGHVHERLLAAVEAWEGPAAAAEVRRASAVAFAYVDAFTAGLSAAYAAEREAWLGSLAATRRQVVDDVLAGRRPVVGDPDRVLGTALAHRHMAVVLWDVGGAVAGRGPAPALHRVAAAIGAAAGGAGPLVVPDGASRVWMWTSWPAAPAPGLVGRVRAAVTAPPGVRAVAGPVAAGPAGFRESHLAAQAGRRVLAGAPPGAAPSWLADHAELDLLALLTADAEQARWFVRDLLGALAAPDPRTVEVRRTLRRYLASGRSRSATAAALHIVPNTVAYRVRQAEALLGAAVPADTLRLRVALELIEVLGGARAH